MKYLSAFIAISLIVAAILIPAPAEHKKIVLPSQPESYYYCVGERCRVAPSGATGPTGPMNKTIIEPGVGTFIAPFECSVNEINVDRRETRSPSEYEILRNGKRMATILAYGRSGLTQGPINFRAGEKIGIRSVSGIDVGPVALKCM